MELFAGFDDEFEPQIRARSNTWPLRKPENYSEPAEETLSINESVVVDNKIPHLPPTPAASSLTTTKKTTTRRNAWGNLSYADLITQAITLSPDKRLTLSQIYEWMVQNVPYFKDKGESNSSAGWKNSIRHNLSLHNRFMRVQNECTGKSSWWVMNPEAAPGKSSRRRAASMETGKLEKRRGRAKKMAELMRQNSALSDIAASPRSSVAEGLDTVQDSPPFHYQSSTTYSCCFMQADSRVERMPSSSESLNSGYLINRNTMIKPPWDTPLIQQPVPSTPSTVMGQLVGALNSSVVLDDLNINVEAIPGGFDCNVEELIKHELKLEGKLEFNFVNQQQNGGVAQVPDAMSGISNSQSRVSSAYSTTVTRPSWVH